MKKKVIQPQQANSQTEGSQPQAGKKAHREGAGRDSQGNIKYENEKKGRPKIKKQK